jgi:hypothetical protein
MAGANRRIAENELELYAMDRLTEEDAAPIEEHLLVCEQCQDRLVEIDAFVRTMGGALWAHVSPERLFAFTTEPARTSAFSTIAFGVSL